MLSEKSWVIKNKTENTAEILIYGEIVETKWDEDDWTAKELNNELDNNHRALPLKKALEMCQYGLIESASKDKATGGNMDIGVLSPKRTFLIRGLTKISNHEDFYDVERRNLQKCKKYNEKLIHEKGSLDKILLGA